MDNIAVMVLKIERKRRVLFISNTKLSKRIFSFYNI